MNNSHLVLTFANQIGSPEHSVLRLSPDGKAASWIALRSVAERIGHINGVCGAIAWSDRLAFCTQTAPAYLVIIETQNWELVEFYLMPGVADPHGLVKQDARLLVASTGTNEIYEMILDGDRIRGCRPIWSYPEVNNDADYVHLNGLSISPEGLRVYPETRLGIKPSFGDTLCFLEQRSALWPANLGKLTRAI